MKKIIQSITLFLCLCIVTPQTHALSVTQLKQWKEYKVRVDGFIQSNEQNKEILEFVQERLTKVIPQKDESLGWLLVEYIREQVEVSLSFITLQESKESTSEINKQQEEQEKTEKIEFPGFLENYNDNEKNILAGEEAYVYAGGAGALHEDADVDSVVFYVDGAAITDIKSAIEESYLYVEGVKLATSGYSSIDIINPTRASITFKRIENFIVPSDSLIDFRLALKTNTIGYEKIGKTMKNLIVSSVDFPGVTGLTSGRAINNIQVLQFSSENFSIVPALLSVGEIKTLTDNYQAEINIQTDLGKNTQNITSSDPKVEIETIHITASGNGSNGATYEIYNTDDSSDKVAGIYAAGIVSFDISSLDISHRTISEGKGEKYAVRIVASSGDTIFLDLAKDFIEYNVVGVTGANNIKIYGEKSIPLGLRTY